ncbi:hypothetical protein BCR42DRAFT_132177 [Absidia repens]|uniref:HAT C-terminal dimerisation domain-containing protein n=1 Tax=Absidia repens TaxID=90262 RepID=A0A1X2IW06_9FUNG|nr:hypothetical protein BCR42DRAFT_132177 [Absidia repens]
MLCMENNRLFTVNCTNKSTSGQWKHLKAKYYEIYKTIKDVDDKVQPTIDEIFQRQFTFDSDKFNVLLAEWLVSDDQSFNVVQSPFFKSLLSYLNPSVAVPTAVTMRTQIISNFNNNRSNFISQLHLVDSKILYQSLWTCGRLLTIFHLWV